MKESEMSDTPRVDALLGAVIGLPTDAAPDHGARGAEHIHDWRFDGDDPYLVCACGQRSDALTGKPLANGACFVAEPSEARREVEQLRRIETAASILLSSVNAVMPVDSPYRCPHTRDWLNGVLDDLRRALHPAEGSAEK